MYNFKKDRRKIKARIDFFSNLAQLSTPTTKPVTQLSNLFS